MPASIELFQHHRNRVFVETGTYIGEGIQFALAAGFSVVRSVELSDELYQKNLRKFAGQNAIRLFHGASDEQLWNMIEDVHEPITFWLDAHFSGGITAKGSENCPILKELRVIQRHPIKTHTIMIDDSRYFGTDIFDFIAEEQVCQILRAINPAYQFSRETGSTSLPEYANDVFVAQIPTAFHGLCRESVAQQFKRRRPSRRHIGIINQALMAR
jgi:hypothetical protein